MENNNTQENNLEPQETYTSAQIFDKWAGLLRREYAIERFLHKSRPELLLKLFFWFKFHKVSYEEAIIYKGRAVNVLSTEEGRKGKGKYKGWVAAIHDDYTSCLAEVYVKALSLEEEEELYKNLTTTPSTLPLASSSSNILQPTEDCNDDCAYIEEDSLITEWSKQKFNNAWTEDLNRECHRVNSSLNIEFIESLLLGNIGKTDKEIGASYGN